MLYFLAHHKYFHQEDEISKFWNNFSSQATKKPSFLMATVPIISKINFSNRLKSPGTRSRHIAGGRRGFTQAL